VFVVTLVVVGARLRLGRWLVARRCAASTLRCQRAVGGVKGIGSDDGAGPRVGVGGG
jgi:hypothetical protein